MANEKILVVDDELPIRLALKTAFLREGMQVQEASCGKEALEALKGDHYDLVVLDVMMEDMDGYTILQKLRAAEDMTPVLMLSGKQEEMDQILGVINNTHSVYDYDQEILDIITDEVAAYFVGDKDVQTTASMIQSRVNLYVQEQR